MSSTSSPTPLTIRPARNDEYLDIARLHYAAVTPSPMFHLLSRKVDPSAWLEFSAEQFKQAVDGGFSSLLVAHTTDTRELVGIALTHRYTREHRPQLSRCQFPEGWNEDEAEHINIRGLDFKEGFLRKYGDYICKSPPVNTLLATIASAVTSLSYYRPRRLSCVCCSPRPRHWQNIGGTHNSRRETEWNEHCTYRRRR